MINIDYLLENLILSKSSILAVYLVNFGPYFLTNHFANIPFQTNTYIGNSQLISVDPPQQTSTVDSQNYKIAVADPTYLYKTNARDIISAKASVYIYFIDENDLNAEHYILIYKGNVANIVYNISPDIVGESIAEIICASPMANLDISRSFHSNKTFMQQKVKIDDTSFDQIYEGSGALKLRWGK